MPSPTSRPEPAARAAGRERREHAGADHRAEPDDHGVTDSQPAGQRAGPVPVGGARTGVRRPWIARGVGPIDEQAQPSPLVHQAGLIYLRGMVGPGQAIPAFVRLAAHPLRWQLLTELAASDYRVRELVALVGQPQNLVSYHLRLLRDGGLVTAARSSFDGRDSYYHLDLDRCADALITDAAPRCTRRCARRRHHRRCPVGGRGGRRGAVRVHRQQRPLADRRGAAAPPHRRPRRGGQRRQPAQARAAPQRRAGAARRVRHRHRRPAPPAPGHRRRPPVRPRDHPVRQGPRGLPGVRRPPAARPLEHPRPGRRRRRRRTTATRPSSAPRPRSTPASGTCCPSSPPPTARRISRDRTRPVRQRPLPRRRRARPPSTSTPPTSASPEHQRRPRLRRRGPRPAAAAAVRARQLRRPRHPRRRRRRRAATASTSSSTTSTPRSPGSAAPGCPSAATSSPAPAGARSCSPTPPATSSNCSSPGNGSRRPRRRHARRVPTGSTGRVRRGDSSARRGFLGRRLTVSARWHRARGGHPDRRAPRSPSRGRAAPPSTSRHPPRIGRAMRTSSRHSGNAQVGGGASRWSHSTAR